MRLAEAYAAAARNLPDGERWDAANELAWLAARNCLTVDLSCHNAVTRSVAALDEGRDLRDRVARTVEILKFPHSADDGDKALERLAETNDAKAKQVPGELWAFVDWVAATYPDIDLRGGPSVERLIESAEE